MNSVNLIGRLTKDPEVRYTADSQMAVAKFSIAVDRFNKNGETTTDFPRIVCFGKVAESVEKFLHKGSQVGISGSIKTGSYENQEGRKIYTTEVAATKVKFLDSREEPKNETTQMGFKQVDEDIPF